MRTIGGILLGVMVAGMFSCTKPKAPTARSTTSREPAFTTYENELFSVDIPKGWVCDSSGWKGLDSLENAVEIFDPKSNVVWFHFVKTFMPIKWKNVSEATGLPKTMIAMRRNMGENIEIIDEIDRVTVGGYPTNILYIANYVDNDTIIQKQFVTYLQDSHIVMYFNENFHIRAWEEAQKFGDFIIRTIKLKKVVNPLEKDKRIVKKQLEQGEK